MLPAVRSLAEEYDMLPAGGTVLCAVSGGVDSMCLLHMLWTEQDAGGWQVAAAHYNHQLRGAESDRDAAFVQSWCRERDIPCYLGTGDIAAAARQTGQGIEETARRLRYAFLAETAERIGAARVATAHNADDNGETLLLHLVRGSGLQGLTGIPPRRGGLIRPLLTTTRADIERYLSEHGVPHVEDSTNTDTAYSRNFLRHEVMPRLRQLNPSLTAALSSAAQSLRADNDYLNAQAAMAAAAARWAGEDVVIRARVLADLPAALALRVVQKLVDQMGSGTVLSRVHREGVLQLARSGDPAGRLDLPGGLTAQRVYEDLLLTTGRDPLPPLAERLLPLPGQVVLEEIGATLSAEADFAQTSHLPDTFYLSCEKIGGKLTIRSRRVGDTLALAGREGSKTLKKWFIEEKIPRRVRERVPVLDVGGAVAAVAGLGPDRAFLAQPGEPAWKITLRSGCESRNENL